MRKRSQVMVDKVQTIARAKIGEAFGRLEDESMLTVNRAFLLWIGLA
ncbi:type II toxin-antitoxin system PemK/MazF family toxin [Azospirillum oryzae]|nr:type II toxin-antitoxin system PemK/MazF family toxin [Azospirillum oryzae]